MKSIVFGFVFVFGVIAHAEVTGFGQKNCTAVDEERGTFKDSEYCILKISCDRYPKKDPEKITKIKLVGYCKPLESGRCPEKPENCLDDESLAAADIPKLKPLPNRPSMKPCGEDSEAPKGTATITPVDGNGNPVKANGGRQ